MKTLTNPFFMLCLAALFTYLAFNAPAALDFIFDGAILTTAKVAVGVTLLLCGVRVCRAARAAFSDGDANGSACYVVPACYISVALIVASAITSV